MKYLVLAVGGSVELQKGTGGVVWPAGVKHAIHLSYRWNTSVQKRQKCIITILQEMRNKQVYKEFLCLPCCSKGVFTKPRHPQSVYTG